MRQEKLTVTKRRKNKPKTGGAGGKETQILYIIASCDNCPRNTKELAQCDGWTVKLSTTFVTMNNNLGKKLIAAADIDGTDTTKITPRVDLKDTDFGDIWYVGDYSDKNGATKGGFIAIKIINALSTGGFTLQSANKGKTQFSAEFTGFTSIEDQETVPFELYISAGAAETGG